VRFTIGVMLLAVAMAAVGMKLSLWTYRWMYRRYVEFFVISVEHGEQAISLELEMRKLDGAGQTAGTAAMKRRRYWHSRMCDKYAWASNNPWLPVWPDPPEPDY
jgi:hypothetical protein